jgi:hypothetical protein
MDLPEPKGTLDCLRESFKDSTGQPYQVQVSRCCIRRQPETSVLGQSTFQSRQLIPFSTEAHRVTSVGTRDHHVAPTSVLSGCYFARERRQHYSLVQYDTHKTATLYIYIYIIRQPDFCNHTDQCYGQQPLTTEPYHTVTSTMRPEATSAARLAIVSENSTIHPQ